MSDWTRPFSSTYVAATPAESISVLEHEAAAAVVIDLPSPDPLSRAVTGALRVIIDDGPPRTLPADLVVQPAIGSDGVGYEPDDGGAVLAGGQYTLIDPAVTRARSEIREIADVGRRILVTCGGSDPAQMTERYLNVLAVTRRSYEVRVLVGPLNPRAATLVRDIQAAGHVATAGATEELIRCALWCDLALTTLGGTAAELACLGVPNLATAPYAAQLPHLARYSACGVVLPLSERPALDAMGAAEIVDSTASDPRRRSALRAASLQHVDGSGARRVSAIIDAMLQRRQGRMRVGQVR